jgi:hypothetical protein
MQKRHKLIVSFIVEQIVKAMAIREMLGTCLLSSVILQERLKRKGIQSTIVSGYLITNDYYITRHVWLLVDGIKIDIARQVMERLSTMYMIPRSKYKIVTTFDSNMVRTEDTSELRDLEMSISHIQKGIDITQYNTLAMPPLMKEVWDELL